MVKAKALPFKPTLKLSHNLLEERGPLGCPYVNNAADIAKMLDQIAPMTREVVLSGALDSRNRLLQCTILAVGSSNFVHLRVADVFHGAIQTDASAVFLAHNHPSGSLEPSAEDFELTQKVAEAGILLGYQLLDHVIVSKLGYRSLLCRASLEKYKRKHQASLAVIDYVADSSPVSAAWTCPKCLCGNLVQPLASRHISIERSNSIPAHCPECKAFTWLSHRNG